MAEVVRMTSPSRNVVSEDVLFKKSGSSPTSSAPTVRTLEELIAELHRIFEDENVNIEYVKEVMLSYKSNPTEWKKYAKFDRHRYTRNLVDQGNGRFNLMVLAWAEGQGSSIHDHADSHCFMKMLSGSLKETKFEWPRDSGSEMVPIAEALLKTNDVAYINDSIGLHRMENESHSEPAVSLHLYSPPFGSVFVFDQRTGHVTKSHVTFWSEFGEVKPLVTEARVALKNEDYENN